MEFLPTTAPSDQKSSTSATWPVTEASRASLVTNVAPSFFGKHDVGGIIGRKTVTELPDAGQEHEMRIPSYTKIEQITDRLINTICRDNSLQ